MTTMREHSRPKKRGHRERSRWKVQLYDPSPEADIEGDVNLILSGESDAIPDSPDSEDDDDPQEDVKIH